MDALTIYCCPIDGCPSFFGTDIDSEDGRGGMGWNPDGWPRCTAHSRPMKPVRVVPQQQAAGQGQHLANRIGGPGSPGPQGPRRRSRGTTGKDPNP